MATPKRQGPRAQADLQKSKRDALRAALRKRRVATGLSQEDFADSIDMNRAQYSEVERGVRTMRLGSLDRICTGLELKMWQVLRDADL